MKSWLSLLLKLELKTVACISGKRDGACNLESGRPSLCSDGVPGGSLLRRGRRESLGSRYPLCPRSGGSDEWRAARGLHRGASPSWQQTSGAGKAWVSDPHHLLRWQTQGEGVIWGNFGFVRLSPTGDGWWPV